MGAVTGSLGSWNGGLPVMWDSVTLRLLSVTLHNEEPRAQICVLSYQEVEVARKTVAGRASCTVDLSPLSIPLPPDGGLPVGWALSWRSS